MADTGTVGVAVTSVAGCHTGGKAAAAPEMAEQTGRDVEAELGCSGKEPEVGFDADCAMPRSSL